MSKVISEKFDLSTKFKRLIGDYFLELVTIKQKEVLRLKSPIILKFEPNVIQKILNKLPQRVESGGILACRPILEGTEKILNIERANFIKNVSENPYNSFQPLQKDWNRVMAEIIFRDQLLPIEFHSHPISKRKPNEKFFEYLYQMGASIPDQLLAEPIIPVGNYRIAVPQAILIKDIQTSAGFFVGIYGGLIAPRNFEPTIMEVGIEKAFQLGDMTFKFLSEYLSDPKKSKAAKIVLSIAAFLGLICFKQTISFLGFLLTLGFISAWRLIPMYESLFGEEFPYFGIAQISNELKIKIPHFEITDYTSEELEKIRFKKIKLKRIKHG